jgi:hypothetical protein
VRRERKRSRNASVRPNQARPQILKQADPFTEKVVKGDGRPYRARFAALDKGQAEAACRALKRSDIPCMLVAAATRTDASLQSGEERPEWPGRSPAMNAS